MQTQTEMLNEYRKFLDNAQEEHKKLIEAATQKLEAMMHVAETNSAQNVAKSQSVWITGNDNERFLMLNEVAVNQINNLFEALKEVIELLVKKGQG